MMSINDQEGVLRNDLANGTSASREGVLEFEVYLVDAGFLLV